MEKRRFERVTCAAKGEVRHLGVSYRIRVENISQGGALISSDDCIMIPPGDSCALSITVEADGLEGLEIAATAEVVHAFFSMVGVRFVAFEADSKQRLFELLAKLSSQSAAQQISCP